MKTTNGAPANNQTGKSKRSLNPNLLSDLDLLDVIRKEYIELNPKGCWDFFKRRTKSPSLQYLQKRFGLTFNEILIVAGVPQDKLNFLRGVVQDREYYLRQLTEMAEKLGHTPTVKEFKQHGGSPHHLPLLFGSYNQAVLEAGLVPNQQRVKAYSKKQLCRIYKDISKQIGRPATARDLDTHSDHFDSSAFINTFGGLNQLRAEAGFDQSKRGRDRRYTKEQITQMLISEYRKKRDRLTTREIQQNKNLPNFMTILHYFNVHSLTEVWAEIEGVIAKNHLREEPPIKALGDLGERRVAHQLEYLDTSMYQVFNNVTIRHGQLEQQIDHLVVGVNGIFHIETKNHYGDISIDRHGNWTQVNKSSIHPFTNPQGQIDRHGNMLTQILNNQYEVTGLVVFSNRKCRLSGMDRTSLYVMKVENLLSFIQTYNDGQRLSPDDISRVCRLIEQGSVVTEGVLV